VSGPGVGLGTWAAMEVHRPAAKQRLANTLTRIFAPKFLWTVDAMILSDCGPTDNLGAHRLFRNNCRFLHNPQCVDAIPEAELQRSYTTLSLLYK